MFELFKVWLHRPEALRRHLDEMINLVADGPEPPKSRFHWALVHLHIFAAKHELHSLQDLSLDAIQDLYLRCDWDVTPEFIDFLFGERDARTTVRLRRWATAMVAWAIAGGPSHVPDAAGRDRFDHLFARHADFHAEYTVHVKKLRGGRLDPRIKNPQLRIPANKLRNDERQFGFRQCSFHTHRAVVGEGRCPHNTASMELDSDCFMTVPLVIDVQHQPAKKPLKPSRSSRHETRPRKHEKTPSCPTVQLPSFEFPRHAPAPLRRMTPTAGMAEAF